MVFFDGMAQQNYTPDIDAIKNDIQHILIGGEKANQVYRVIQTLFIFTDKRLILLEQQSRDHQRVKTISIPYRTVTHFTMEVAGTLSMDSQLTLHLVSGEPVAQEFKGDSVIHLVHKTLAGYLL